MANSNGYALGDISGPSSDHSFSRRSSALGGEAQNPTPFTGQDHGVPENHPYDPSSAHLSPDTTSQRRLHGSDLIAEWGWEIAAWLLAAVSLVALLSVFGTYSGNPLSQWRSGITPSTVVQILSQFGQTALLAPVTSCICQSMWLWLKKASKEMQPMDQSDKLPRIIAMQWYDDGSRGPLGSLMLLWKHPGLVLVWLGTINTFLIILFGTFAQQTLQLPLQEHNGTFPGLVWRSLQYRAGQPAVQFIPQGTLNTFVYQSVPDLISAAITDGLLRTGVSPSDIPGDCPTGNCTFPAYQTMGVCSNIIDVSSTITSKCRKRASQFRPNGCNYSVPAVDENPTATERTLTTYRLGETLWIGASNTPNYKYPDINTLVQFYIIYVPDLTEWATLDYTEDHKEKLVALQATLNLCLYTYATRMTFGVTRTAQFAKSPDLGWQTGTASGPDENTSFQTVTTTHDSETFWMSQLNVKSFNDYLSLQTFTGSASMRPAGPSGGGNTTETDTVRVIASSIYDDPGSLYGIKTVLDNLAVSMTNGLRNTSDVPATVSGTSSRFDVYIQIEWAWMAVPIAAVILSLIFLLLTISLSRRSRIPAWKSSPLALMYGLNAELRQELGRLGRPLDMEAEAKGTEIRLEAEGGRWQIAKAM